MSLGLQQNWKTYLAYFLAGFLIGLLLFCRNREGEPSADQTKTKIEVRYRYVTSTDTFIDSKPRVVYVIKPTLLPEQVPSSVSDTVFIQFKPSDYAYTYNKSFWSYGNRVRNDIKLSGWGKLENIESSSTISDTLADTVRTVSTTKFRVRNAVFAGLRYQQSLDGKQSLKQAEIDWNIRNRWLLGIGAGVNENNQFQFGGKVGVKIR